MSFDQPYLLVLLLTAPVLLAAYLWQLRRRRRQAVRHSHVALVRTAAGPSRGRRRHIPVALVLASLALLGVASARPQVQAEVPVATATVILALDVSGSMCATDVEPNRLSAAQAAVRGFVERQSPEQKIGLVIFSGFAQLAVPPTTARDELLTTLDQVTTGRGTTIGAAILTSINAIAEIDSAVAPADLVDIDSAGSDPLSPPPATPPAPATPGASAAAPVVAPVPEVIVLLTDGANTRGISPAQAAQQAAARGVRIYPIGFGTTHPTQMACTRDQYGAFEPGFGRDLGRDPSGGPIGGRGYLVVDEAALKQVAQATGGQYFSATDADELLSVLTDLPKHVVNEKRDVDLSAGFAALSALLLLAGLGLSLRWNTLT